MDGYKFNLYPKEHQPSGYTDATRMLQTGPVITRVRDPFNSEMLPTGDVINTRAREYYLCGEFFTNTFKYWVNQTNYPLPETED